MTRLVKIELLKLTTVRVGYGVLAVSAALTALFASLEASRAGSAGTAVAPLFTASGLSTVTTVTGWSMMFAAVLGVIVAAGEFRHATATLTYLDSPNRGRVLAAEAIVGAGAGAVFGLVSALIATTVAELALDSPGVSHDLRGPSDVTTVLELFDRRYRDVRGEDAPYSSEDPDYPHGRMDQL